MRTINGRFLLVSLGLVAIIGVGANLLHEIQVRRSAGILLEMGMRKIDESRPAQALGYMTRYVKLAPQNAQAQIDLANTLVDLGQNDAAIKWYEQALLRDASRHEARRRLVEISIATHRYSAAKAHLTEFLLPYTPEDPQVYYLLGLCHEGLGEYDDAINRLREAVGHDPKLIDAYATLATLLRDQRKNPEDADSVVEQLVAANPKSAQAFIARADYRAKYRLDGVADDVRMAVQLAPEDPDILFRSARMAIDLSVADKDREKLLSDAEQLLQKGVALEPRFAGWYLGLAQVDRSQGNLTDAVIHIEEGLVAVPNNGDLQWNFADLMIEQDKIDEGLGIVARLRDQSYPKVPLEYLVAMADARRKKYVDASERLSAIRGQMEAWPDLARQTEYWLGVCYERLGEYGLQLTAFRNAVKIDPSWVPARQWLANALARTGRVDEAITEYQELAQLTGVPGTVYRELARLLVLQELQRPQPQRNWSGVIAFLDRASKVDTDTADYVMLRAEIQAAQGDREAAGETLKQGIREFPDSVSARLALAALEQSAERWDVASRMIDATQGKFGDTEEVRLGRLRYLVQRYGIESSDRVQALEQEEFADDADSQQRWRTSLAAAYYTLGKTADARRLWQQAVKEEPDNIRLRMFLFDMALAGGDDAEMQKLLDDIGRIERSGERPLWHYGEATRLVVQARKGDLTVLPQAESLLEEVRAARATWSRIPLLQAEIDDLRGRQDKEIENFLSAIELGERSPTVIRRVVELLYRQRRYADADNVLRKFEATQLPITGELGRLAADVAFRVQDFSRAMQIAAHSIGDSDKYEDLVWMAQLDSVMGQRQAAEERFQQAIKKQPHAPDAWIAIVQHFIRNDSPDQARRAIKALSQNVDQASASFVEAICLRALSDYGGALAKFDEALQPTEVEPVVLRTAADFFLSSGMPARGEVVLNRLLSHPAASKEDAQWARRNLAIIALASPGTTHRDKALALVEQNLKLDPTSADDRRAKALCLESFGGNKNLEAGLAIIEALIQENRSTSADQLIAYRLCAALDRKADARRYLEQHTFENSDSPQNLARYIHFVLGNDELGEAQIWINRLEQLCTKGIAAGETGNPQIQQPLRQMYVLVTGFQAQLLLKRGSADAAVKQIAERIGGAAESGPTISSGDAVQLIASLGQELAKSDPSSADAFRSEAETQLRKGAVVSARQAITLVMFMAQQGRLSDAVTDWQAFFDASAADEFAIVAAAMSAQPQLDSRDLAALTDRLLALPAEQRSRTVLSGLTQLLAFQGRHVEAIATQREILAKDSEDVATINNLACYLALGGGDKNEALKLIDSAIEKAGPIAALLDSRGLILLELDRPEDAVRDLEQAIGIAPSGPMYLHLAAAEKQLHHDEQSAAAIKQAWSLGLDVETLHPLERTRFREFLKQAAL
jgi:tetratricopeptide (TPR) repeat protein